VAQIDSNPESRSCLFWKVRGLKGWLLSHRAINQMEGRNHSVNAHMPVHIPHSGHTSLTYCSLSPHTLWAARLLLTRRVLLKANHLKTHRTQK